MTTSLSQGQADLPKLVEIASRGEDVIITIEGQPKAKLTRISPESSKSFDGAKWMAELEALNQRYNPGPGKLTTEQILAEDREDRF